MTWTNQDADPLRSTEPETYVSFVRLLGTGAAAPTKQRGAGITVTRTSAGLIKLTWGHDPGTFVGLAHAFRAATPGDVVDLKLVGDTYASKVLEVLVAAPYTKGNVASSDPASIAAGAVGTVTLAVTGAAVGDTVMAHPRDLANGLVVESYSVSAADTVTARLFNPTAAAVDDVAQTWEYVLFKNTPTDLAADQYLDLYVAFKRLKD